MLSGRQQESSRFVYLSSDLNEKLGLSFPPFELSLAVSNGLPFQRFLLVCFCLTKPSHFSGDHYYLLSQLFSLTERGS